MPTLTWIGHSAFILEDGDNMVLIDPFVDDNPVSTHQADALHPRTILLTHAHNDHVGDTVKIAKRTGAKVISTFELGEFLRKQGVTGATPANHGGTVRFDGGSVKLTELACFSCRTPPLCSGLGAGPFGSGAGTTSSAMAAS